MTDAEKLKAIRAELAALVADPNNPDWFPALTNGNKADAECLQKAFELAEPEMMLDADGNRSIFDDVDA